VMSLEQRNEKLTDHKYEVNEFFPSIFIFYSFQLTDLILKIFSFLIDWPFRMS